MKATLAVLLALAIGSTVADSATIIWTNTSGGNWSAAANWSPNQVPGSSDNAAITASGSYTVTLNANATVGSLTLGGASGTQTLTSAGNTLTLNNASIVGANGVFVLSGGSLSGSGVLTVNGQFNWTGGSIAAGSTLTVATNGLLALAGNNGTDYYLYGVLTNAGTVRLVSGNLRLVSNGTPGQGELINLPGALVDITADVSIDNLFGGELLVNEGTVRKSGGMGTSTISPIFDNFGTLDVQGGTVNLGSSFTANNGSQFIGAGTSVLTGGAPTINGLITSSNLVLAGATLTGTNGVISGVLTWTSGSIAGGSTLTVATNGLLVLAGNNGTDYTLYGVLTNAGTVRLVSGNLRLVSNGTSDQGELINLPGALVDITADVSIDDVFGGELLVNEGTVRKSGGMGTSTISPIFDNFGTLDVQSGTVSINGGGSGNGVFEANAGATLEFTRGYTASSGVQFIGAGTNLLSSGTFTLDGNTTIPNLVLAGATLTGTNGVISGVLTWTSGSIASGSTLTVATNGVLALAGNNGTDYYLYGVLTNAGTVRLVSGNLRLVSNGTPGQGELINLPGALVDITADVSIDNLFGGELLVNEGTVRKSGGMGTSTISPIFDNFGTLDVQSGTVNLGSSFTANNGSQFIGAGTSVLTGGAPTINGLITSSNLVLAGATLTGTNGVISGVLTWTSGSIAGGSTLTVATNGLLVLAGNNGTDYTLYGVLTNAGTVRLVSGNLRLVSNGTSDQGELINLPGALVDITADVSIDDVFGGELLVNEGTVRKSGGMGTSTISPIFDNFGTLDVQSGTVRLNSSYSLTNGTLNVGISGPTNFGAFILLGNPAQLSGGLSANLNGGYAPATGSSFPILGYSSANGQFTNMVLPVLGPSQVWQISYNIGRSSGFGLLQVVSNTNSTFQITGSVADSQGHAVANIAVFAYTANSATNLFFSSFTDANGNYALNVPNGIFQVGLEGLPDRGYNPVPNQLITLNNASQVVNFVLQPYAGLLFTVTTEVNPPGAGKISGGGTYSSGSVAAVTANPTPGPLPYVFGNWSESGVVLSTNTPYDFVVYGNHDLVANFIWPSPVVTMQPKSQTVVTGAVLTLSVAASGAQPISYQWQFNGTNLIDGGQISGSQSNVLNITQVSLGNAGDYRVILSNAYGSTNSAVAVIGLPPDLAPTVFTAATNNVVFYPPNLQSPTVQVSWAVTNLGGIASGYWYDAVYVSTNTTIAGAVSSSDYSAPGPVSEGGQYGETNTITLPQQSGTYYLILSVNDGHNLYEGSYSNNTVAVPITLIYQVQAPDLASISVAAPTTLSSTRPNPAISITWGVTNQGTGLAAGIWRDRVWFATNGVLDANSSSLGDFVYGQTVPVGGGYSQTHTVTLPMTTSGNYTLFVQVNVGDTLYESNYANNISVPVTGTFTLTPPDLQVLSVSMPQQAWTDRAFDASWVLTNAGLGVATGPWVDRVYLSATNQLRTNLDQVLGDFAFEGQLGPGQTVQLIHPVTINRAGITNGPYYVSVLTDVSNNIFEITRTNNVGISSSNIYVQLTPLPELTVASVDAPTNGIGGQPLGVRWIVCNQGQADTEVPIWYDHLYLSTTTNLAGVVQDFGKFENPSYLAVGDCYEQDVTVTLPAGIAGPFYFIVNADATGLVNEDDTTNNLSSTAQPINIQLVTPGFLHVASVQVAPAPPTAVLAGQTVTVTWTVQNIGETAITTAYLEGWDDEVTLSPTPTYDFVHGYWDVIQHIFFFGGFLAPGQSYSHTNQFVVPQGITPGNWYTVPIVDPHFLAGGTVPTIGSGNIGRDQNSALVVVSTPPPSDLAVTSVSAPALGYAGQPISVSWVVNNQGLNGTSSSDWQDGVYLSTNGVFDPNQNLLLGYSTHWGALGIGASYTNKASISLPASVLPSNANSITNILFVYTDIGNAVVELTKTNNVLEAPKPLTILPAPPLGLADLAVTSVSVPSTILAGGPASVFWTVTNEGAGVIGPTNWVDSVYLSLDGTFNPKVDIWLADMPQTGSLAPGGSYTVAQDLSTPYCVLGSYFVVVVTDSGYQINQSGAVTNNVLADPNPMRILPNNAARLEVSSVSSASSVTAGAPLAVSWTVANLGNNRADAAWIDGVYLSSKPTYLPGSGYLLDLYTNQANLSSGGSYSHSGTYTVPPCFAGTYYVAVVNDLSNVVDRISCDTNNIKSASTPVQVLPAPYPSLQIAGLTLATTLTSGVPWTVQWSVTNAGTGGASGTWFDAVYASPAPALDASAVLLGHFAHNGGLPAGAAYTQSQLVQIPACTAGQDYIFVVADVSNAVNVTASCLSNNPGRSTNALEVNFGLYPDLTVTAVSVPSAANAGQPMTLSWTVTNAGQATATGPWVDAVYLSANSSFIPGDSVFLGDYPQTSPLAPRESRTETASFTLPDVHGSFYLAVFTDSTNAVEECQNETNKVTVSATTVNVPITLYPDLKVTAVQVPAAAHAGQPITVIWVVTNEGTDSTGGTPWNDAVYLAEDEVLDPGAVRLGTVANVRSLGVGQSYTNSATVVIPPGNAGPFYILVLADSGGGLFEHLGYNDSLGWNPSAILVTLPPPADLAASNVTLAPASGTPGTATTIGWTVSNVSTNDTVSTWTDAIYLSTNSSWDITATPVANVNHTSLAAGGRYSGSWTGPLPALSPGGYYAIVRADIRNTVPEVILSNNTAVSSSTLSVDVPVIALGQTVSNQLSTGSTQFYRVNSPAGQTVRVALTGAATNSFNELFVRFGAVPDLGAYDFIYQNPMAPNQEIDIPTTQAGWYYIMVRGGNEPGGPLGYTLTANVVPFAITSVTPTHIGDNGQVTITLSGAKFQPGASVQLVSGNTVYSAATNFFDDATSVRARFFFTNAIHGIYDVVLTNPGNQSTTATQAIAIETALPLTAEVVPGLINSEPRVGLPFNWNGAVVNAGNVDIQYVTVTVADHPSYPITLVPPPSSVSEITNSTANSAGGCAFILRDIPPLDSIGFSFVVSGAGSQGFSFYVVPTVQTKQDFSAQFSAETVALWEYLVTNENAFTSTTTNLGGTITTNMTGLPQTLASVLSNPANFQSFLASVLAAGGLVDTNDLALLPLPQAFSLPASRSSEASPLATSCQTGCYLTKQQADEEAADAWWVAMGICTVSCLGGPEICFPCYFGATVKFFGQVAVAEFGYQLCLECCQNPGAFGCTFGPPVCYVLNHLSAPRVVVSQLNEVPPAGDPLGQDSTAKGSRVAIGGVPFNPSGFGGSIDSGGGIGSEGGVCPVYPKDPNEKQGPTGYSNAGFVGSQVPWQYTIYFENTSNAPAFARQVSIKDMLDPSLDIRTFRVGNIVLGNTTIAVPTNSTYYQSRISLPPPNPPNIVADITAGVNVPNGSLFWTMNAIDLNTGQLVTDTQEGVLPPNTTNNIGAGYVTFSIKPTAGVPTGTVVTNQATIVFDINDPLPTNPTTNTVDALPPTSFVAPLPPVISTSTFTVSWAGVDDPGGSGLASFNIFFSDNGGPSQVWLANTATNSAQFTGQFGHTYAFYSTAQDNSGNLEAAHATPDTTTLVSSPPVMAPVADQTINVGTAVIVTNTVIEADQPAPALAYSLGPNAPAGAYVNPTNGVFTWTPQCGQGSTTNLIEVNVNASDDPTLTNSILFNVVVGECVQVGVGSTVVQTGRNACAPVNLLTTVALTNLSFTLAFPTDRFTNWIVSATNPVVANGTAQVLDPSHTMFSFTTRSGQTLQGPTEAGTICFSALPGSSGFIPLVVTNVAGTKADGSPAGNASGEPGRVVVIGPEPLLEARLATNHQLMFTIYGNPGTIYEVDYSTNLSNANWWYALRVSLTNSFQFINVGAATNQSKFFRAKTQ